MVLVSASVVTVSSVKDKKEQIKEKEGPQVGKKRKCEEGPRRAVEGRRTGEELQGGDGYGHARKKMRVGPPRPD